MAGNKYNWEEHKEEEEIEIKYKDKHETPVTFKGTVNQGIRLLISLS